MGFGRKPKRIPKGSLPIFSVDTEEEAQSIIVMTCKMDLSGKYYAPELAEEQTLERLYAFGDRLRVAYQRLLERRRGKS